MRSSGPRDSQARSADGNRCQRVQSWACVLELFVRSKPSVVVAPSVVALSIINAGAANAVRESIDCSPPRPSASSANFVTIHGPFLRPHSKSCLAFRGGLTFAPSRPCPRWSWSSGWDGRSRRRQDSSRPSDELVGKSGWRNRPVRSCHSGTWLPVWLTNKLMVCWESRGRGLVFLRDWPAGCRRGGRRRESDFVSPTHWLGLARADGAACLAKAGQVPRRSDCELSAVSDCCGSGRLHEHELALTTRSRRTESGQVVTSVWVRAVGSSVSRDGNGFAVRGQV